MITETIYKDVIRVFTWDRDINIWENRVEDYLDDTRRLLESEIVSFEVKVAHDLFDINEYDEVARKAVVEYVK